MNAAESGRHGIRWRSAFLVGVAILVPLAAVVAIAHRTIGESTRRLLDERRYLAESAADNVGDSLSRDMESLLSLRLPPRLDPADPEHRGLVEGLQRAWRRSRYFAGACLLDREGRTVWEEPAGGAGIAAEVRHLPEARAAVETGLPRVTGLRVTADGARRAFVLVPVRDWKRAHHALAAASLDLDSPAFRSLLHPWRVGRTGTVDLVDGAGIVLASTDASRLYLPTDHERFLANLLRERRSEAGACHNCHGRGSPEGRVREVLALAPVPVLGWGVAMRQSESEAWAAGRSFLRGMLWLVPVLFAVGMIFAWGAARSLIGPLRVLTGAAERIAEGDLGTPVPPVGPDEIGRLGRSLEAMRGALARSVEEITAARDRLEEKVRERTAEIRDLYEKLQEREKSRGRLLVKAITAQEEERKRIARELHDETCQEVTAVVMKLDSVAGAPPGEVPARLGQARTLAQATLAGLHRMIFTLRPPVLDDIGLFSAIRLYATRTLEPQGISVRCEIEGEETGIPPEVSTPVFRACQEALTNVARHAEAESVLIQIARGPESLGIEIEDDGVGFDPASVRAPGESGRGLGLLGIRERADLVGGRVEVDSAPGRGTRIMIEVPLPG